MAAKIPGAKYVELPDEDHLLQALTPDLLDLLLNKIEEFITGVRHRADPDRALATIMFTDMVRSTEPVRRWATPDGRGVAQRLLRGGAE